MPPFLALFYSMFLIKTLNIKCKIDIRGKDSIVNLHIPNTQILGYDCVTLASFLHHVSLQRYFTANLRKHALSSLRNSAGICEN